MIKQGFTLSEVLITLGIIGVIAALTIPSVLQNYRNRLYTAQLKKTYNQLVDAAQKVMADEHAASFYETTAGVANAEPDDDFPDGKGAYYFLNNYFKTIKTDCNDTDGDDNQCYSSAYSSINGETSSLTLYSDDGYCVQTVNGAAICMVYDSSNYIWYAFIDVNGADDPNIAGRDAFTMVLNSDGTLEDWSTDSDDCGTSVSSYSHIADYSAGCITKIIEDGWVMNY